MEQDQLDHMKSAVEAVLFVGEKPVTVNELKDVFPEFNAKEIKTILQSLKDDYDKADGGLTIEEIAGGYQMLTQAAYAPYIRDFLKTVTKERLSKASLESLAIIAYKQPVTRTDIELIRGVNSDGVVSQLLNKGLIGITGRKEVPGRPFMYGTTKQFLEFFGLKALEDMPNLEDFALMTKKIEESSDDSEVSVSEEVIEEDTPAVEVITQVNNLEEDEDLKDVEALELEQSIMNGGDVQELMVDEMDGMLDAADAAVTVSEDMDKQKSVNEEVEVVNRVKTQVEEFE